MTAENTVYQGDNLDILKRHVKSETVDLIYLDPPFNSKGSYSYRDPTNGNQVPAFEDTWHWDGAAVEAYQEVVEGGGQIATALVALRDLLGANDMMAYLSMMAPRLRELHRVLKETGSIFLHCDPTASHYLKVLLDAIFDVRNFRNEIVWKRTSAHGDSKVFGRSHDIIFYYTKSDDFVWNKIYQEYDPDYVETYYRYEDSDGRRFMSADLSASGLSGGGYEYDWKGVTRVWRVPVKSMKKLDDEGRIYYTRNGFPRIKRYLDEAKGILVQDVWTDIQALRSWHAERLEYPTQKPEALLERIIKFASNEGDLVLDPFCGSGTTLFVAARLGRRWIGIDQSSLATALTKRRLRDVQSLDAEEVEGFTESQMRLV